MKEKIITKQEAKIQGMKFYFTGIPCKRGHYSNRRTASGHCVKCSDITVRKWMKENSERCAMVAAEYRKNNQDKVRNANINWKNNNQAKYKKCLAVWHQKNKEVRNERRKARYKTTRERELNVNNEWRKKNRKKVASYSKARRLKNPEKVKASVKKWRENNPDKCADTVRRRRARKMNAEGTHTLSDVLKLFILQGGKCAGCSIRLKKKGAGKYHVDHVLALSKGGSDYPSNLQLLCPTCNHSKHCKDPIEWAHEMGRLL